MQSIVLSGGPADGVHLNLIVGAREVIVPRSQTMAMKYSPRQFHFVSAGRTETFWMPADWTERQATAWLAKEAGYGDDVEGFLAEA